MSRSKLLDLLEKNVLKLQKIWKKLWEKLFQISKRRNIIPARNRFVLCVTEYGDLVGLYDDLLCDIGVAKSIYRASNIEWDNNRLAWMVFFPDGSTIGPYKLRRDALNAERELIETNLEAYVYEFQRKRC